MFSHPSIAWKLPNNDVSPVAIARKLFGTPNLVDDANGPEFEVAISSQKSRDVLGMQYRDMKETAAFMLEDSQVKGCCYALSGMDLSWIQVMHTTDMY